MRFDYMQYFRGCFSIPVPLTLLGILASGGSIVFFIEKIIAREIRWTDLGDGLEFIVTFLFGLSLGLFFVVMNGGILFHGGMYLVSERGADAVGISGTIQEIDLLDLTYLPNWLDTRYTTEERNGVRFTIDGVQCICIAKGDLKVGDYVTVVYLPKSSYVLEIYKSDPPLDEQFAFDFRGKSLEKTMESALITE